MKHADALKIAQGLAEHLRSACTRIEIAGSIRRGKPEVKDIEIVAIPDPTPLPPPRLVFGQQPVLHKTALDKLLFETCLEGWMRPHHGKDKYKKFIVAPKHFGVDTDRMGGEIMLDLFLVTPPAEWGVQMAIRTGPADFSHWCVTRVRNGGVIPNSHRVQAGAVWLGATEERNPDPANKLSMPEEIDFFNFLGLGWIEPGDREAKWKR